jgi:catechol 2,3-dioxygenase
MLAHAGISARKRPGIIARPGRGRKRCGGSLIGSATCDHDPVTSPLDPATTLGPVRLRVAELAPMRAFYERALGLHARAREDGVVALAAAGGPPLVELREQPGAAPRPPRASGLFHLALLLPSRAELARALERLAREAVPLAGASEHLVSEALYLADPEGNGIELYRDRPREQWTWEDGELRMATLPLDLGSLLADAPGDPGAGIAAGTRLGHVHLQVPELAAAEAFYGGLLGFGVTVRGYPGALFLAAGDYHHHVGLNTWASRGGPPNAPGTRGLERFDVVLPDPGALEAIAARLADGGAPSRPLDGGLLASDPFGNDVVLRT